MGAQDANKGLGGLFSPPNAGFYGLDTPPAPDVPCGVVEVVVVPGVVVVGLVVDEAAAVRRRATRTSR